PRGERLLAEAPLAPALGPAVRGGEAAPAGGTTRVLPRRSRVGQRAAHAGDAAHRLWRPDVHPLVRADRPPDHPPVLLPRLAAEERVGAAPRAGDLPDRLPLVAVPSVRAAGRPRAH